MTAKTMERLYLQNERLYHYHMQQAHKLLKQVKLTRVLGDPRAAYHFLAESNLQMQLTLVYYQRMQRPLTWQELYALADKNYEHGGNGIVECWNQATFDSMVAECGPYTYKKAMELLELYYQDDCEIAGWC